MHVLFVEWDDVVHEDQRTPPVLFTILEQAVVLCPCRAVAQIEDQGRESKDAEKHRGPYAHAAKDKDFEILLHKEEDTLRLDLRSTSTSSALILQPGHLIQLFVILEHPVRLDQGDQEQQLIDLEVDARRQHPDEYLLPPTLVDQIQLQIIRKQQDELKVCDGFETSECAHVAVVCFLHPLLPALWLVVK